MPRLIRIEVGGTFGSSVRVRGGHMPHSGRRRSSLLAVISLSTFFSGWIVGASRQVQAAPADEAAVRSLADAFFAAYASKDLDRCMTLWSAAPERGARQRQLEQQFNAVAVQQLRGDRGWPTTLLAFGNPSLPASAGSGLRMVYGDAPLQPLPDAEREVDTLRRILYMYRRRESVRRSRRPGGPLQG